MANLEALAVPEMPKNRLAALCLILEDKLADWLLSSQIRHITAFGSSPFSLKARYTRLLARLMALHQTGWREKLDRDKDGRSFFTPSGRPAAFAYGRNAVFCCTAQALRDPASLAIDAEYIPEHPDKDMMAFLTKIFPSLRKRAQFSDPRLLAALWTAYECAYKIIGWKISEFDLPACFPAVFRAYEKLSFRLPGSHLHFRFTNSGAHMVALATQSTLSKNSISCCWTPVLTLPS